MYAPIADAPEWIIDFAQSGDKPEKLKPSPALDAPAQELSRFEHDLAKTIWDDRLKPWRGKVEGGRSPMSQRILHEPELITKGKRNGALYSYLCLLRRKGHNEQHIRTEAHRVNARIPEPMSKYEVDKVACNALQREQGSGGHTLRDAWLDVQQKDHEGKWHKFLMLVEELHERSPKETILLPMKPIGTLMGVHFTQVSKWRKRAITMGILKLKTKHIRGVLADEFTVDPVFTVAQGLGVYKIKRGRKAKVKKLV